MSNKEAQVDWDDDGEQLRLGDIVQSLDSDMGVCYTLIGIRYKIYGDDVARIRVIPGQAGESMHHGWHMLQEDVYECPLNMLELVEA